MAFSDYMLEAQDAIFEELGEPGSYLFGAGPAVESLFIVQSQALNPGEEGGVSEHSHIVSILRAEIPAPRTGAVVSITGGQAFRIDQRLQPDDFHERWLAVVV